MCAEGEEGSVVTEGEGGKDLRGEDCPPIHPSSSSSLHPQSISPFPPPIPFRDSFTLRISRAGDRASNPFPDAFLIVWESRQGWDRMGLGWWVSQCGWGGGSPPLCHPCG